MNNLDEILKEFKIINEELETIKLIIIFIVILIAFSLGLIMAILI